MVHALWVLISRFCSQSWHPVVHQAACREGFLVFIIIGWGAGSFESVGGFPFTRLGGQSSDIMLSSSIAPPAKILIQLLVCG